MSNGTHLHAKGYIRISAGPFRGKLLHQLIWKWTHPQESYNPAFEDIHHLDGDPTNFAPENLQKVPHQHHSCHTQAAGRLARDERSRFCSPHPDDLSNEVPF
ncbi:MAG: HNH endonuclease [Acidimicrobiales bacterium]